MNSSVSLGFCNKDLHSMLSVNLWFMLKIFLLNSGRRENAHARRVVETVVESALREKHRVCSTARCRVFTMSVYYILHVEPQNHA